MGEPVSLLEFEPYEGKPDKELYEFVIGLHDCMLMTIDDPGTLIELLEKSAAYYEELIRKAVSEGIDILLLGDRLPSIQETVWEQGDPLRGNRPHLSSHQGSP